MELEEDASMSTTGSTTTTTMTSTPAMTTAAPGDGGGGGGLVRIGTGDSTSSCDIREMYHRRYHWTRRRRWGSLDLGVLQQQKYKAGIPVRRTCCPVTMSRYTTLINCPPTLLAMSSSQELDRLTTASSLDKAPVE